MTVYCISRNVVRVRSATKCAGDLTLTTYNGTSSQCIRIGQKRHPRESGTMGPSSIPIGTFDYIVDHTKVSKFNRASPIGRSHMRKRSTQVDFCRVLCFYSCDRFFPNSSTSRRAFVRATFSPQKGVIPSMHVSF